jgi:hypothetical protein
MTTPEAAQEPKLIEAYSRAPRTWRGQWHPSKPGITFYPDTLYYVHPACFSTERFMLADEWRADKQRRDAEKQRKEQARIFRDAPPATKEVTAGGVAGGLARTFAPPQEADQAPVLPEGKPEPTIRSLPAPTPAPVLDAEVSTSTPDAPAAADAESETTAASAPKARGGKPSRKAGSPAATEA